MICTLGKVVIVLTDRLLDCPGNPQQAARSNTVITITAAGSHLAAPVAGPNEEAPPTSGLHGLLIDR